MVKKQSNQFLQNNSLTKESLEQTIKSSEKLTKIYKSLEKEMDVYSNITWQDEFMDFCMGKKWLPLTYDPFFKFIFNPETHPERLSDFLSELLKIPVKVKRALPMEGGQIIAEGAWLIMDIVVELEDGSLANVEIQKVPYLFCGERGACYSSDLLLRQYNRVKKAKDKKFSYHDLKPVYTIVLLEKSDKNFWQFPKKYLHQSEQIFNTGLHLELLQKYVFIPLDIFQKNAYNIDTRLEAWLHCIASKEPEIIQLLLYKYPDFAEIYKEIEVFRTDVEEVLNMFSEALAIMDRNAVSYMIEELQKELEERDNALLEKDNALAEKDTIILKQEQLSLLLIATNRIDDLKRSLEDKAFQQKLFEEFHL